MNEELEAAKKKLRDACVEYLRAAFKATGSAEITVLMLAKGFSDICDSFKESELEEVFKKVEVSA